MVVATPLHLENGNAQERFLGNRKESECVDQENKKSVVNKAIAQATAMATRCVVGCAVFSLYLPILGWTYLDKALRALIGPRLGPIASFPLAW